MATVRELLQRAPQLPGDSARRDTEILLCHSLDKTRTWLYTWPEAELSDQACTIFDQLFTARAQGQPIAYLTGYREFWSLPLQVNEHTLIPRPETETLVQWALELELPASAAALDLGTGSGAIALALANERPQWQVSALDASEAALAVANTNADVLGLQRVSFLHSSWYGAVVGQRFDLLVSNPPYVDPVDKHLQQGDVRFEPRSALASGEQGLADLRCLVVGAPQHLQPDGWLLLEHGYDQGARVRDLLHAAGFTSIETRQDDGGNDRITGGIWC
jgi:release factor glutamine methyltransferase